MSINFQNILFHKSTNICASWKRKGITSNWLILLFYHDVFDKVTNHTPKELQPFLHIHESVAVIRLFFWRFCCETWEPCSGSSSVVLKSKNMPSNPLAMFLMLKLLDNFIAHSIWKKEKRKIIDKGISD